MRYHKKAVVEFYLNHNNIAQACAKACVKAYVQNMHNYGFSFMNFCNLYF